jgi:hypothetical protein
VHQIPSKWYPHAPNSALLGSLKNTRANVIRPVAKFGIREIQYCREAQLCSLSEPSGSAVEDCDVTVRFRDENVRFGMKNEMTAS